MCKSCLFLNTLFSEAGKSKSCDYSSFMSHLNTLEAQDQLQLVAGDCPIKDATTYLECEEHYAISHYVQCKCCNQYFFVGACIRGTPKYKVLDTLNNKDIERMLWGRCGTWFGDKQV